MLTRILGATRFWIIEFGRRISARLIRNMPPNQTAFVVREFEKCGQPFEIDLLGISPELADVVLQQKVLAAEEVLQIPAMGEVLVREDLAFECLRVFNLQGSILDANSGLAFVGSRVVTQSGTGHRWVRDAAFITSAFRRIQENVAIELVDEIAWFGVNANYYHLLVESLPRLIRLRDVVPDIRLASTAPAPNLLREIDEDLADRVDVFDPGTVIQTDRFWTVTPQPLFVPHPADLALLRNTYIENFSESGKASKLFVSRGSADRLPAVEEALHDSLQRHGFRAQDFAKLPWRDQVELASSCDVMVGIHGAGLTNLVFMRPGGHVIEISDGEWWFPCYRRMAAACGLRYSLVVVRGEDPRWHVDQVLALAG